MRWQTRHRVALALAAPTTAMLAAPSALAQQQQTFVPSKEAWFQQDTSCGLPLGCLGTQLPSAPVNAYPADTLHVGFTGSQEVARTYLAFPFGALNATILGGELEIPLDTEELNGSQNPEGSFVQVCLLTEDFPSVQGSTEDPPAPDCAVVTPAQYVASPTPHLIADLAPLASGLSSSVGLALIPDPIAGQASGTWRVVFSTRTRAGQVPATVTLSLQGRDPQEPLVDPAPPPAPPSAPRATSAPQPPVSVFAPPTGAAPETPAPEVAPPAATPAATTVEAAPASQIEYLTFPYAYPGVWLLPLALLLFVPAVSRAMTRDLTPSSSARGSAPPTPATGSTMTITAIDAATVTLADGRVLSYAIDGATKGPWVIHNHGTGSSRFEGAMFDDLAKLHGFRLLTIDRPSYGLSTPVEDRSMTDWPADVVEVADALGIKKFAVSGYSGGGPHALATALAMPKRVSHAVVINCGCGTEDQEVLEQVAKRDRNMWIMARENPAKFVKWVSPMMSRAPGKLTELLITVLLPKYDRELVNEPTMRAMLERNGEEARRQPGRRFDEALLIWGRDWGFDPYAIDTPMAVFSGLEDSGRPFAVKLAATAPNAVLEDFRGGHAAFVEAGVMARIARAMKG